MKTQQQVDNDFNQMLSAANWMKRINHPLGFSDEYISYYNTTLVKVATEQSKRRTRIRMWIILSIYLILFFLSACANYYNWDN